MKKTKTLFDQAIEIIEAGGMPYGLLFKNKDSDQSIFMNKVFMCTASDFIEDHYGGMYNNLPKLYTRLLLARELWNDGQEKYWKAGLFK